MRCRVGGLLLVFAAVACTRREDPRPAPFQPPAPRVSASAAPGGRLPAEERTWSFPQTSVGRMSVVVVVPERAEGERLPVLIALHGRGETLKGPERGARGWVDDYRLGRATQPRPPPPPPPPRPARPPAAHRARLRRLRRARAPRDAQRRARGRALPRSHRRVSVPAR